ncbi:hypothetical protein D3C81_1467570 [compost metagenome]
MVAGLLHHLDRKQRLALLDLDNGIGQCHGGGGKDAANLQMTVASLAQAVDLVDEVPSIIESDLCIAHHLLAQGGGRHTSWQTLEQGEAEQVLDLLEHLADRRLAEVHLLGCQMHVVGAAECVDEQEVAEFKPVADVRKRKVRHESTFGAIT